MTRTDEWAARVEAYRASGLSARKFCEGEDFGEKSLYYWNRRLRKNSTSPVRIAKVVRTPVTKGIAVEVTRTRVELQDATLLVETLEALLGR